MRLREDWDGRKEAVPWRPDAELSGTMDRLQDFIEVLTNNYRFASSGYNGVHQGIDPASNHPGASRKEPPRFALT